jgi:hypothetical protein
VTIACKWAVAWLQFSEVYDPTADLLRFLEAVQAGLYPRISINEEGDYSEVRTGEAPVHPGWQGWMYAGIPMIRLVVFSDTPPNSKKYYEAPRAPAIDVALPREVLWRSIYGAWRKVALSDRHRLARQWLYGKLDQLDRPADENGASVALDQDIQALLSSPLEALLAGDASSRSGATSWPSGGR